MTRSQWQLVVVAVAVALLAFLLSIPFIGPVPALAVIPVTGAMLLVVRFPVVSLLLPLVVAPVAFQNIPGTGGLQVVHLAVVAAVGGVLLSYVTGRIHTRPPLVLVWAVVVGVVCLITTITSVDPIQSLKSTINQLLGIGLAVAAAVVVRQSREYLTWVLRGWAAASTVVILPAIPSAVTATDLFAGSLVQGRAQGVFSQPNDFGEFSMYAVFVSWAVFAGAQTRWDRALGVVAGLAGAAGVAVSFSRGTWVGIVAAMVVAVILATHLIRPVGIFLLALSPVFAVAIATGTPPFAALSQRLTALFAGAPNPDDDRSVIYSQAWRLLFERPLTGSGPGTYAAGASDPGSPLIARPYIHAHNVLLTSAAEMGTLGIAAILILSVATAAIVFQARSIVRARLLRKEAEVLAILAAGLVGIAFHGILDFVYTNPFLIPLAWMQWGMVAGLCAYWVDRSRGSTSPPGRRSSVAESVQARAA